MARRNGWCKQVLYMHVFPETTSSTQTAAKRLHWAALPTRCRRFGVPTRTPNADVHYDPRRAPGRPARLGVSMTHMWRSALTPPLLRAAVRSTRTFAAAAVPACPAAVELSDKLASLPPPPSLAAARVAASSSSVASSSIKSKTPLLSLSLAELEERIRLLGQKPFVAKQIWKNVYRLGRTSFEHMSDIKTSLRQTLDEQFEIHYGSVFSDAKSNDGTRKWGIQVCDGCAFCLTSRKSQFVATCESVTLMILIFLFLVECVLNCVHTHSLRRACPLCATRSIVVAPTLRVSSFQQRIAVHCASLRSTVAR